MPDAKETSPESSPASPWQVAAERLRSTARLFVVSLGSVAVVVVAGLSLTGLSTLNPVSVGFKFAVAGALLAILGAVIMLALAMRLASASAVTMGGLLALSGNPDGKEDLQLWVRRHLFRPGYWSALKVVNEPTNGGLAGYASLNEFVEAAETAYLEERTERENAAKAPDDIAVNARHEVAIAKAAWFKAQLRPLIGVASIQRLHWNFGATAVWMTLAGAVTALGVVTYAAALQPRDVPSSPVAVTAHQRIQIKVPDSAAAAALYKSVVGCGENVEALVLGVSDAEISAITMPAEPCRSVTLTATWDGTNYIAKFV